MAAKIFSSATSHDADHRHYITRHQVRFGHVDPAGIAYFPRIHNYLHEAFENLWDEFLGMPYYRLIQDERIGFPMVRSEVDFKSPLRFGDRPVVRITCFKLGRSSLGLRYLYDVGSRLCVDARMITACIDLDTVKTQPIPERYRARFAEIFAPLPAAG
ncbi:MAG TPA: thioesterase family protein [Gammaproteobacteria bacterium]